MITRQSSLTNTSKTYVITRKIVEDSFVQFHLIYEIWGTLQQTPRVPELNIVITAL